MNNTNMKLEIFRYRRNTVLRYQELFEKFVQRMIEEYKGAVTVILFGSRGRGDNRMSSDFDVMVVIEGEDKMEHYMRILKLKPLELPVDLVIIQPSELRNPVIKRMLNGCKVIYDGLKVTNG